MMRVIQFCSIACLVSFLVSCACAPEKAVSLTQEKAAASTPEETIVGEWTAAKDITMEFLKDGTMRFSLGGESESRNYEFIDKNQMRITIGDSKPLILGVLISTNKLSLTTPDGKVTKYARGEYLEELKAARKLEELNPGMILNVGPAEAFRNLAAIRVCLEAYFAENGTYLVCPANPSKWVAGKDASTPIPWDEGTAFDKIGFRPKGDVRYQYSVAAGADGIATSYSATATGDLDEDSKVRVFTVTSSYKKPRISGDDY